MLKHNGKPLQMEKAWVQLNKEVGLNTTFCPKHMSPSTEGILWSNHITQNVINFQHIPLSKCHLLLSHFTPITDESMTVRTHGRWYNLFKKNCRFKQMWFGQTADHHKPGQPDVWRRVVELCITSCHQENPQHFSSSASSAGCWAWSADGVCGSAAGLAGSSGSSAGCTPASWRARAPGDATLQPGKKATVSVSHAHF